MCSRLAPRRGHVSNFDDNLSVRIEKGPELRFGDKPQRPPVDGVKSSPIDLRMANNREGLSDSIRQDTPQLDVASPLGKGKEASRFKDS